MSVYINLQDYNNKYEFTKYNKKLGKSITYKIVGHVDSLTSEGTFIMLPKYLDIPKDHADKHAIRVKKYKVDERIWEENLWRKVNIDNDLFKYIY